MSREQQKSCGHKKRHASREGAIIHMKRLGKDAWKEVHPYRCKFCKGWHIGHGKRGRTISLLRAMARAVEGLSRGTP